jgi:hypothetical protein
VRTYNRTDAAGAILARGFRNRHGYQMTDPWWRGVWLSDSQQGHGGPPSRL